MKELRVMVYFGNVSLDDDQDDDRPAPLDIQFADSAVLTFTDEFAEVGHIQKGIRDLVETLCGRVAWNMGMS